MNLLIKLPTRERPEKFFKTLLRYQHLRTNENTKFLITLDANDTKMNNQNVINSLSMWGNLTFVYGESNNKIHACNRDLNEYTQDWDIVLLASDDMIPQVEGYDDMIIAAMKEHFPDTDGVLHFNDGYTKEKLNTLCIAGRKYYERDKYLYNPEYISLWSDNEWQLVSEKRGKSVYIDTVIIKHEHPMNTNTAKMDASYQKTLAYYAEDKLTFERRKAMNFGLDALAFPEDLKFTEDKSKDVISTTAVFFTETRDLEIKPKNKGGRPKKVTV